ncbi:MAG: mechanosensitive ion channel protein MscS [Acidobacteria bacterium]|nr:MAG: mechanosensitive ion channel protein MscS [Acidobacteriota bacterium]
MLAVAVFFGGALFTIEAQETRDSNPGTQGDTAPESNDRFTLIEETLQEIEILKGEIEAASGGDRTILESRAREKILEVAETTCAAADDLLERESDGEDVSGDRQRIAGLLQALSPRIHDYIDRLSAALGEIRDRRDAVPPEEQAEFDEQLIAISTRLDQGLAISLEQKDAMESLGLDIESEREFLETTFGGRAELLAGRISLGEEWTAGLERRIQADPENAQLKGELQAANARLERFTESLDLTIQLMDDLGMETAQYKQQLFQVTGEITTNLFSRKVLAGLARDWAQRLVDWISTNGAQILLKIALFLLIMLGFKVLSRIARRLVKKGIAASHLDVSNLLERTAVSITGTLVMIFGFLVALSQFGVEVGPLLAGLGVAGFIVGFALQDTLSNFAAGVMILLYRPYDVGDLVETAGASGTVSDMSLVATTILTLDHQTLVVPNSKIWGDVIKNVTAQKIRRVDMVFGISYSDDIPHAEGVLNDILDSHPMVLDEPERMIKLHNLGESSVDFVVRPWAKTEDYWDVYWDVTREVKMRFDAEKISIPFPQQDVHLFENK